MRGCTLIPLDGIEDAETALRSLPQAIAPGDDVVFLAMAITDDEKARPRPATVGGRRPGRDASPSDQAERLLDWLEPRVEPLRNAGHGVRLRSVVTDEPAWAVLDCAVEIDATDVAATEHTFKLLDRAGGERFARVLPL